MAVQRIYDLIVRNPTLSVVACVVLALGLASFLKPEIDTSLRIWFLDDDPDVATYDRYVARFETDEFVAVALTFDDLYTTEALQQVAEVTEVLGGVTPIERVNSLSTLEVIERDGETLRAQPLFDAPPTDTEALAGIRVQVEADPMLQGLVSDDGRSTVIVAEHPPFEDLAEKALLAGRVRDALATVLEPGAYRVAGNAFMEEAIQDYTWRDLFVIGPLTILMIIIVTWTLFRDLWCTIVPSAVVTLTLASAVGLAGMFGVKLNMITTIVIPLSMAVGIADSVHLLAGYRERLADGTPADEALRSAWTELLFPCTVTTATTAFGLGSLLSANLVPIRQFGWMGAATVTFALLYTLVLVPAVFCRVRPPRPALEQRKHGLVNRVLVAFANASWRRHRAVLAVNAVLVTLAVIGVTRIEVGADFSNYFRDDDPLTIDMRWIDRELGGSGSVDVMIEADDIRDPEVLRRIEAIQARLDAFGAVQDSDSPAELASVLHERWFGDPERRRVPDSLAASAQLLSQTEGTEVHDRLMTLDYGAGRIRGRFQNDGLGDLIDGMPAFEAEVDALIGEAGTAELTGIGKLIANLDRYIIESQIRSFLLAFVTVAVLLGLFFRSWHIGGWALVPNALPIVLALGVMGWMGIQLDVGTVMVASIMLGLIVDDTVHYLARYRREWRAAGCPTDLETRRLVAFRTGTGTGRALTTTSVILACAFFLSLAASFQPSVNFGLMCGVSTLIALVCDLVSLPAVIRAWPLRSSEAAGGSGVM